MRRPGRHGWTLDVQRTSRYPNIVIRTFACRKTERLWNRSRVREFENIAVMAMRRLTALDGALELPDLLIPPGNRLEAMHGDRLGQHSLRINDQYRICFIWKEENAYDVEITKHYE
jgi:proteic killer suppression protein